LTSPLAEAMPVGWREWVALPGLKIPAIKAKMDTGARTSALHTFRLEALGRRERLQVRFWIHPLQRRTDLTIMCVADVLDIRTVSDSGGHRERRYVIRTPMRFGEREWPIELSLTNREDMLFRLLLGRTALTTGGLRVEPAASYLGGRRLRLQYSEKKALRS
jgi:hypothetical protein